jgi:uroporphyrin-III C-methyltransferase / precorrin-2 dehydrogenase / sirohydrochlorin ferrochelatase
MTAPGKAIGRVSLVGAGPGDPDLLTVRACRRLGEADLVLFDALAAQDLRPLAPEARWFYVGKRAGRASMAQDAINRLMVREARRGNQVVRLKGGDPFVFGRGGEEALALADAGVPFEVIPGISSAVAAPGSFGIPVTHRGAASGFCVVSGHAAAAYGPVLDALPQRGVTLVVLMGFAARADIAARLLGRGFPAETPAALLVGATTPEAFSWMGRHDQLGTALGADERVSSTGAPVMIVIGEVVTLAAVLGAAAPVESASVDDVDATTLVRRLEEGSGGR